MSRRNVTIEDLYAIRLVADPNISPDGKRIAYVVTTVDRKINGYKSAIWMVDVAEGSKPFRFTSGNARDAAPRWSPDGSHLAFLSTRKDRNQIWVMPVDGGEAWQVTSGPNAVTDFCWAPDGESLFFVSRAELETPPTSDTKVITTLIHKMDGEGFWDGKRRQIWRVSRQGGEAEQVTTGDYHSVSPAPSPDGKYLAFVSNRTEERDNNTRSDVWLHSFETGEVEQVSPGDGWYSAPTWSADGSRLAWYGHPATEQFGGTTLDDIYVWEPASGETRTLMGSLDREPGNSAISDSRYGLPANTPFWNSAGDAVLTLLSDRGSVNITTCPVSGAPQETVGGVRDIQAFTVARDGTIAFAASTLSTPTEVFVVTPDGQERQVTNVNAAWLEEVQLADVREVTYESDPGVEVHGWLFTPPNLNERAKYPAIIEVHGGPHGMYGTGFFHEMQVLAGKGYVVLMTNPRGSTGYGQEWVAATREDWGGADYRDVMGGVPFLESLGFVDPDRIGITGGSYGGYVTNWAITQTNRFRAAVTQRSTANRYSLYGTSDLAFTYSDWEFGGTPYDNPEAYAKHSPITYVKNVETPLLILHSENDLRCSISQGEEFFTALKRLGKTVEFVRFPNESHGLSRAGQPVHRVERLERICNWFDQYL
jgi:dipeptidyl aminopeptidase/acylaminoacyl peptidase